MTAANTFLGNPTTSEHVVEIRTGDARAVITREPGDAVRVSFTVRCGSVSTDRHHGVVEAVFARPEVSDASLVRATVPLGDVELLWQVERHLRVATTRAAGASCLIDGTVRAVRRDTASTP